MPLDSLKSRLQRLSGRLLLKILMTGLPRVLLAAVAFVMLSFLLDMALRVPVGVRVVFLLAGVAGLGYLALRHLLVPLVRKPSIDQLALMVEAADPGIRDQLISAVQLERDLAEGRAVESPELIRALVDQTAERFRSYSMARAVPMRDCARPVAAGLLAVVAVGALATAFPFEAGLWVERQLLLRDVGWPRETTLLINVPEIERFSPERTGDRVVLHVPERTPLQVQVTAEGILPEDVDLVTAPLDQPDLTQPISMGRPQGRPFFQHIFPPLSRSLLLHAVGGDDQDGKPVYEVRVARAPRVTSFNADLVYPEYTGLEDRTLSEPNLAAPEGTRVTFRFEVNMPLEEFVLSFQEGGEHALEAMDDGRVSFSFVITEHDFYTYRMRGTNGVKAPDAPRHVITAEADQAPRVVVDMPGSTDLLVTTGAILPIKGRGSDDYGVTEVGFRYGREGTSPGPGVRDFSGEELLHEPGSRTLGFFAAIPLAALEIAPLSRDDEPGAAEPPAGPRPPEEGDRLSVVFRVADNRRTTTDPEPHRVFGDYEYRLQVVSADELERSLAQRQSQLKRWITRISEMVATRIQETRSFLEEPASVSDEGDAGARTRLLRMEQEQNRVTRELANTSRLFQQVFDGYLWNRLDPANLTETLVSVFQDLYREPGKPDRAELLKEAIRKVRPILNEGHPMGRLTIILDLLSRAAYERSPRAHRLLAQCGLVAEPEEQTRLLNEALAEQERLYLDLQLLAGKLQDWEDYMELVQKVRDILDTQKGIGKKIERLTRKGEGR